MRSRLKLNQRLLLWFFLLSLGPIGLVAYHGYYVASGSQTAATEAELRRIAQHRVDLLRAWLDERRSDLDFILETARRPCPCGCLESEEVTFARACATIENGLDAIEQFERIELFDLGWELKQSTEGRTGQLEFWDTSPIRAQLSTGEPEAMSHVHDTHDGVLCVCFGGELRDADGKRIGYLLAAAELSETFREILWSREPELGGRSLLVTESGDFLASSTPADSLDMEASVLELLTGDSGNADYRGSDGEPVLAGYARFPELGALFIVERDRKVAFAWLSSLAWQISLVALLCILAVSMVSRHLTRALTRPLQQLVVASQAIGGTGGLASRVPPLAGHEFQEVGEAFNRMLDQLELSGRKLVESASLAAAGELSTSVVHELRNPLSSVRMNLQALRQKVEDDAVHRELADIACEQVCRIDRMLGDLMDFAKPLPVQSLETDLDEVIQASIQAVSADLQSRGVDVEVENALAEERLFLDPDRLCQSLTNLLQNAIHASPEGCPIHLAVRPAASGRCVEIEVRDYGRGLSEDNMDRLFKPFFTTKANGSGLGLANARKLIRLQGGDITARNHATQGAVFTVSLPRSEVCV